MFLFEGIFESAFTFSHFDSNTAPKWINESLNNENIKQTFSPFNNGYLVLSSIVETSERQYKNIIINIDDSPLKEGEYSNDELIYCYKEFVVETLSNYAFLFSLAANIAKPGVFQFSDRYQFQDRSLIKRSGGTLNTFELVLETSIKYSWPLITELKIPEVWNWLIEVPGFLQGESKTKLGRALGALSYLLNDSSKDSNELALVWALIGLESLYGKSNVGLKSQLLEKSEAFLGKRTSHKKVFGDMYDFRSRLIHGDKNFFYKGFNGDFEGEYFEKLMESEIIAIATLISTFQKMCVNQIQELNFSIVVE